MSTEGIGLPIPVNPTAVLVALVTGDDDDGARTSDASQSVEHVRGAKNIGLNRADGIRVTGKDQRARGEVEDDIRFGFAQCGLESAGITNVGGDAAACTIELQPRIHR